MADPVTATLLAIGASAGTAAAVGTAITVASTAFTLYSAFQTVKLPDGPRLGDLSFQSSTYGQAIPRVYGTDIVKGNVIWMRDNQIQENFKTKKLGKKSKQKIPVYTATYALAVGEGVVSRINRIWIDGKIAYRRENDGQTFKLAISQIAKKKRGVDFVIEAALLALNTDEDDYNDFNFKFYNGDYTQEPDPTMQGFDPDVSAFRGVSYLFFNRLDLEPYGNRIPDMTIELFREAPIEEEIDVQEFGLDVNFIPNNETSTAYELVNYYTNNTILPKVARAATGAGLPLLPVVSRELYSYQRERSNSNTLYRPMALKYADPSNIVYSFCFEAFGLPLEVGVTPSDIFQTGEELLVSYKDTTQEGVVNLNNNYCLIAEYNCQIPDVTVTSNSATGSPTDLTVLPQLELPRIHKLYPWDFPLDTNETMGGFLASTGQLTQTFFIVPVINSPDLYITVHGNTVSIDAQFHLVKTVNGRCSVKRIIGLYETVVPLFGFNLDNDAPLDWAAVEVGNKIFLYTYRGHYKIWSTNVNNVSGYTNSNFKGLVSFNKPVEWDEPVKFSPNTTMESYLTTIETNGGYYVSRKGLNDKTQITDWEYFDDFNPIAIYYDDESNRVLILNELAATPAETSQAAFFANLQFCLLSEDFSEIEETYTYTIPSVGVLQLHGICTVNEDKIYLVHQNKLLILDRNTLTGSATATSISTGLMPNQLKVYSGIDNIVVVEGDYFTGRGRYSEVGYYNSLFSAPEFQPVPLRALSIFRNRKTNANFNNGVITLGEIVSTEIKSTGYLTNSDIDVSEGTTSVSGIVFSRQGSILANLQALAEAYFYFLYEEDYKIKLALRQNLTSKATITDDFLNAREVGTTGFKLKNNRPSSYKMPAIFEASYRDPELLYEVNTQSIERAGYDEPTKQNIELAMSLSSIQAKNIVLKIIKQVYLQNEGEWELTLPGIYSHLEAGHLIVVDSEEYGQYQLLIKSIDKGRPGIVKITGIKEDPNIYGATTIDFQSVVFEEKLPYKQNVSFVVIDSLPFDAVQDGIGFWVAAWNDLGRTSGYGLIQSEDNFLTYESLEKYVVRSEATALVATTFLTNGDLTGVYNTSAQLTLSPLNVDSFSSVPLASAYTAFYGNENRWEIIKFTDVVDNANGTYTISNILRGYKGTEFLINSHEIGDYLVIVDGNLTKLNYAEEDLGKTYQYKIVVPGEKDINNWPTFTKTLTGFGREPLQVAHLTGFRDNSGNLTIKWVDQVRYNIQIRDRVEGFSDESTLSFTLAILDSSDNVIRSVTVSDATTFIYTATMQISDFGSLQNSVKVAITKDSLVMGTGLLLVQTL